MIEATTVPPELGVAPSRATSYGGFGEVGYARTTAARVLEDNELTSEHFAEVGSDLPYRLRLDHAMYQALEDVGVLRVYAAAIGDRLIGYASYTLNGVPHAEGELHAFQDTVFVRRAHRPAHGRAFLRYCDAALEAEGVDAIHNYVPVTRDFGPVLERLGYVRSQIVYTRRVRHGR